VGEKMSVDREREEEKRDVEERTGEMVWGKGERWSTSGINLLQPRLLFTVAIGCSVEGGSSERTRDGITCEGGG
jgi:hypothetical protein